MQGELENQDELQINLAEVLRVMIQKIWIIILCMAVGATLLGGYTKFFVTPLYSAASTIYVLPKETNVSDVRLKAIVSEQLTADFILLAKSRQVVREVIHKVGTEASYAEVVNSITIENPDDSHMITIMATHPNPEFAKDVANTMADVLSVRIAEVMNADKPSLVETAVVPGRPSSPNVKRNTILGGMAGAVLSIAVIFLLYILDDTIKDEDDVKRYLGVNTLATFPEVQKKKRKKLHNS